MHGMAVTVLHGSTMQDIQSGVIYKMYSDLWWVPVDDTDEQALARIRSWDARIASDLSPPAADPARKSDR